MESLRFVDLFAGLGGFHHALSRLGHTCVFASEIDPELRVLYRENFSDVPPEAVVGDIRAHWQDVPRHDVLCAGFPCQPFSKSGSQLGTRDSTRGTLFHEIIRILEKRSPSYVVLENVGNFARHDNGRTWSIVQDSLTRLGYNVQGTEHLSAKAKFDWRDRGGVPNGARTRSKNPSRTGPKGSGLLSPHHFGEPHHRERFFIVASKASLPTPAFPSRGNKETSLTSIVQPRSELSAEDLNETRLSKQQRSCIRHWNSMLKTLPHDLPPPGFPLWGDELNARYPYEDRTPWATAPRELGRLINGKKFPPYTRKEVLLQALPSYARERTQSFRRWKVHFIHENRRWWRQAKPHLPSGWASELATYPASLRKLEWHIRGRNRNLWDYVLQFRPSGLRARRYDASPALVAMTATQIPILGPEKRFLTRTEGLRLQGLPDDHCLPAARSNAFRALGNAVHTKVAAQVADHLIRGKAQEPRRIALEATP